MKIYRSLAISKAYTDDYKNVLESSVLIKYKILKSGQFCYNKSHPSVEFRVLKNSLSYADKYYFNKSYQAKM